MVPDIYGTITPIGMNANTGTSAGMSAGGQFSAAPVTSMVGSNMMIDPAQQAQLQKQFADQTATEEIRRQALVQGYGAGLANQVRNADTQRSMAINAQQNAAANVANQLNNLANIRNQSANAIAAAMQAGASIR